jgi:predicted enzyme related to lactoylglutathione lyase
MSTLKLVVLKTAQLDRAREFYAALGVAFAEEQHGTGPLHYAGRVGDAVLELYPLPEGVSLPDVTTRLGFAVDRLDEVMETIRRRGGDVVSPPKRTEWGYRAVVRDPDGRAVELYEV